MDRVLGNLVWRITGDNRDFNSKIDQSKKGVQGLSGGMRQLASIAASAFSVVAITNLSKNIIGAASSVEESINAVQVVFKESSETILAFGKTAAEAVGLSTLEFNKLATSTGALLNQAGLDITAVGDKTIELTQRAADVASVFDVDVSQSLGAFGAALRGEAEPARIFGVNISDAAVQIEALNSGLVKNKSEITDQIKVQARYNLILQQTADTAGDFANTQGSFSNQTKILQSEIANLSAEFGEVLIPFAKDIVGIVRDIVKGFSDLSPATKKLIVGVVGITGAVVALTPAIGALSAAFAFLAANPIVLAIAAFAALTIAIVEANEQYKENLVTIKDYSGALEDTKKRSDELLKSYDEIGKSSKTLEEKQAEEKKIQDELKALYPKLTTAKLNQAIANGTLTETIDLLNKAQAKEAKTALQSQREQLTAQLEDLNKRIEIEQKRLQTVNTGVGSSARGERAAAGLREQARKNLEALGIESSKLAEALRNLSEEEKQLDGVINGTTTTINVQRESIGELTDETNDGEREKTAVLEEESAKRFAIYEKERDFQAELIGGLSSFFDALISISTAQTDARVADLNTQLQNEKLTEKEREKIQREIAKVKREQAEKDRALALFNVGIATAQLVVKAFQEAPYPFNIALAALYAGTGVAQIAAINAAPLPAFEKGGIVGGNLYQGDQVTARVNSGEMILDKQQQAELFNIANGGGGAQTIQIVLDGKVITEQVVNRVNNGQATIKQNRGTVKR
jgi:hypothetical protein